MVFLLHPRYLRRMRARINHQEMGKGRVRRGTTHGPWPRRRPERLDVCMAQPGLRRPTA